MRFIVVDVGNTSTAVGLWRDGVVSRVAHFDDSTASAMAYASKLTGCAGKEPEALAYLSVVPRKDAAWRAMAGGLGLRFLRVDHRVFAGFSSLRLDYPRPETIGADRLADAAAAADRYGVPVIVCDFGTAFTAAAITADGVWRGGVIAPGFPLMRDYLFERTAKLPKMELGGRCPKIGRSTEEAMRFGALVGYRGMVREIVTVIARNFKTDFRLVATGGFARWVLKGVNMPFSIDATLTLHGAGLLASAFVLGKERKKR